MAKGKASPPVCTGYCYMCCYYARSTESCDYIFMTGKRRPCPAGKGCTERALGGRETIVNRAKWDTEKARQLYMQGYGISEIAAAVGASRHAVHAYRSRCWKDLPRPEHPGSEAKDREKLRSLTLAAVKGMGAKHAELTAQAIHSLWRWQSAEDLRAAAAAIEKMLQGLE